MEGPDGFSLEWVRYWCLRTGYSVFSWGGWGGWTIFWVMKFFLILRLFFFLVGDSLCKNVFKRLKRTLNSRKQLLDFFSHSAPGTIFSAVFSLQEFFLEIAQHPAPPLKKITVKVQVFGITLYSNPVDVASLCPTRVKQLSTVAILLYQFLSCSMSPPPPGGVLNKV